MLKYCVLIGIPGCGKGTYAKKILEKYKMFYVPTGEILRNNKLTEGGNLLSNEIVINAVTEYIRSNIIENNTKANEYTVNGDIWVLLDGFPRQLEQYYSIGIDVVLFLDLPEDVALKRILSRNSGRDDDNAETFKKRIEEYNNKTLPVVNLMRDKNMFFSINSTRDPSTVFVEICETLDKII